VAEPVDVAVLGERLKRARTARAATLKEVAEQTEISIATLSRIERGDAKSVDSPTLLALAKWMGARAAEFLERPDMEIGKAVRQQATPDVVELHLRADKNLDKRTAVALAKMFRAAYESLAHDQRREKKRG
jgi:transcriptional regulator with XRE-family HTH domain